MCDFLSFYSRPSILNWRRGLLLDVHYYVLMATERGRLSSLIVVASCKTSQMSAFLFCKPNKVYETELVDVFELLMYPSWLEVHSGVARGGGVRGNFRSSVFPQNADKYRPSYPRIKTLYPCDRLLSDMLRRIDVKTTAGAKQR